MLKVYIIEEKGKGKKIWLFLNWNFGNKLFDLWLQISLKNIPLEYTYWREEPS